MSRQLFECLEALGAVAETGSLTRAAETLGISVSQASRRIKNLSDEWGVALLARAGTATILTPEAARLLEEVAPVLRAFDNLERRFQRTRADEVSVEAPSALASVVLAPLGAAFSELGLRLQLRATDRPNRTPEGELDFSIVLQPEPPVERVIATRLGTMPLVCAASPDYLERNGDITHPDDLSTHAVLTALLERRPTFEPVAKELQDPTDPEKTDRPDLSVEAARALGRVPETLLTSDLSTHDALLNAALSGAGVAVGLPRCLAHAALRRGDLVEVLRDWRMPAPVAWLLRAPQRYPSPRIQTVVTLCRRQWSETPGLAVEKRPVL